MRQDLSNLYSSQSMTDKLFQTKSKIRLLLIVVALFALFFLIIQPSAYEYLLQSSPMLWECM